MRGPVIPAIACLMTFGLLLSPAAPAFCSAEELKTIEFSYDGQREMPKINIPAANESAAVAQNKAAPAEGLNDEQLLDTLFSSGEVKAPAPSAPPRAGEAQAAPDDASVIYLEKSAAGVKVSDRPAVKPAAARESSPAAVVKRSGPAKKNVVVAQGPRSFSDQYANGFQKSSFNPRARAVVNPHPSPRPPFAESYPKVPGRSDADFRLWELGIYNWSRVSGAEGWRR